MRGPIFHIVNNSSFKFKSLNELCAKNANCVSKVEIHHYKVKMYHEKVLYDSDATLNGYLKDDWFNFFNCITLY